LNFETRELDDKVHVMPQRSAEEWLAVARTYEAERQTWPDALYAYEQVLRIDPQRAEAVINSGTLHYEQGDLTAAAECFAKAVALQPTDALAQFNLGSVLDESGRLEDARHHLRQAVSLNPDYSDAHYNLAFVCEKLGAATGVAMSNWIPPAPGANTPASASAKIPRTRNAKFLIARFLWSVRMTLRCEVPFALQPCLRYFHLV
jgi:tetratricopeptide (TPR) repeat protein